MLIYWFNFDFFKHFHENCKLSNIVTLKIPLKKVSKYQLYDREIFSIMLWMLWLLETKRNAYHRLVMNEEDKVYFGHQYSLASNAHWYDLYKNNFEVKLFNKGFNCIHDNSWNRARFKCLRKEDKDFISNTVSHNLLLICTWHPK